MKEKAGLIGACILIVILFLGYLVGHETKQEPRNPHWPKVREEYLKEHPTCEACGGKDKLQVHHVLPFHLYPEKELDPDNLITLCTHASHNCHFFLGHSCDWKAYNPDVRKLAALCLQSIKNRKYARKEKPAQEAVPKKKAA